MYSTYTRAGRTLLGRRDRREASVVRGVAVVTISLALRVRQLQPLLSLRMWGGINRGVRVRRSDGFHGAPVEGRVQHDDGQHHRTAGEAHVQRHLFVVLDVTRGLAAGDRFGDHTVVAGVRACRRGCARHTGSLVGGCEGSVGVVICGR